MSNTDLNTEISEDETLSLSVNDLGNIKLLEDDSLPPQITTTSNIEMFVKSVNDPPNLTLSIPVFTILQDDVRSFKGIIIDDV